MSQPFAPGLHTTLVSAPRCIQRVRRSPLLLAHTSIFLYSSVVPGVVTINKCACFARCQCFRYCAFFLIHCHIQTAMSLSLSGMARTAVYSAPSSLLHRSVTSKPANTKARINLEIVKCPSSN